ncbi:MAG: hypothetical protein ACI8SK_000989 [Shewanella sp.]
MGNTLNYKIQNSKFKIQNSKLKDGSSSFSRMFNAINGEKLKVGAFTTPNKASHFVAPGMSQLQIHVTYRNDLFKGVMVSDFVVAAELKKGDEYTIDSELEGSCIRVKIINSFGKWWLGRLLSNILVTSLG